MDAVGDLFRTLADAFIGVGAAIASGIVTVFRAVVGALNDILPGPLLPIAVIVVVAGSLILVMRR